MIRPPARDGEVTVTLPPSFDAGLYFLGRIRTPWRDRQACPRRGDRVAGPLCRVEIDPRWRDAFRTIEPQAELEILYWMHLARRDLVSRTRNIGAISSARSRCARRCASIRSRHPT